MTAAHGGHWLERQDVGDVTLVRIKLARLNDDDAHGLFKQIYSLVDDMGRRNLAIDLHAVEFLPSMALGKLVMLNRKAQAGGGRMALYALTADVNELMEVTHLDGLFSIYRTEEEALASFR